MNKKGFTLLEMIIVLGVICLVFLLTLPNIQQKQEIIQTKGCDALIEVVNSQVLLYRIENDEDPGSIDDLISAGYLKEKQSVCPNGQKIDLNDGQAEAH